MILPSLVAIKRRLPLKTIGKVGVIVFCGLLIMGCNEKESGKDTLELKYSSMKRRITGVDFQGDGSPVYNMERPKDCVVVEARLLSVKHPRINSPSISHEKSVAVYEILDGQALSKALPYRKIKLYFGPGSMLGPLDVGSKTGFVFSKKGEFIELDLQVQPVPPVEGQK